MQKIIQHRGRHALVAFVAVAALTLAGCGGGGGGGGNEVVTVNQPTVPPPQQPAAIIPAPGEMILLAGSLGGAGNIDGQPGRLNEPTNLASDASGNVYIADTGNNTMRKITPQGVVSTIAVPRSQIAAVDPAGNFYAFSRDGNPYYGTQSRCEILKTTPAGIVTTFAVPNYACDSYSYSIAVDARGTIYMANSLGVHKITPAGDFTTLGNVPLGTLAVDRANNLYVFLSPYGPPQPKQNTYKVTPDGTVTAFHTTSAGGHSFGDVALDPASGTLYTLGDEPNGQVGAIHFTVRQETPDGIVSTLALTNADGTPAQLPGRVVLGDRPHGMTIGPDGSIFIAFHDENVVMKISPNRVLTTFAGASQVGSMVDGTRETARFYGPAHLAVDDSGSVLVTDSFNNAIRKINPAGVVTTVVANVNESILASLCGDPTPILGLAVNKSGMFVADPGNHRIRKIDANASKTVVAGAAWPEPTYIPGFRGHYVCASTPVGVAVDSAGTLFVPDGNVIRKVTAAGVDTILSCSNMPTCLQPNLPATAVLVDAADNLYVAQAGAIFKITPAGVSSILAGGSTASFSDGLGGLAGFSYPGAMAIDAAGNLFVADTGNNAVRKVTQTGVVTTIAGGPALRGVTVGKLPASLNSPRGIAVDAAGMIYVSSENAILKIRP